MVKTLRDIVQLAKTRGPKTCVVVAAEDPEILLATNEAMIHGIAKIILIGNLEKIKIAADNAGVDITGHEIIEENNPSVAAHKGVQLISQGKADLLVKGLIGTADILKAVLNKDRGLKTGRLLSHLSVFEMPEDDKVIIFSDGAMNIAPSLEEKVEITQNAINVGHTLGIDNPRVAIIAAIESLNSSMPATIDAACISKMAERGQIKGGIIDGPLALDNAISPISAKIKRIDSPVAGQADILIMPDIETGNVFYKSLIYMADKCCASVVVGASVPIVLTSRADSYKSKFYSLALGIVVS
ncbi:MAG: bifunctional enoyl-CoA hydratase/phosphate acetyltransferase [Firmicutes bacterium]|nr:bifunctional enoyl-CoA hydratase/phosphate acetyltransferase [Bacillota bacterium]